MFARTHYITCAKFLSMSILIDIDETVLFVFICAFDSISYI